MLLQQAHHDCVAPKGGDLQRRVAVWNPSAVHGGATGRPAAGAPRSRVHFHSGWRRTARRGAVHGGTAVQQQVHQSPVAEEEEANGKADGVEGRGC